MPPCVDVYVWVRASNRPRTLSQFVNRYVNLADSGDPRFDSFIRTFVDEEPRPGDVEALAELSRDGVSGSAFSLYLRSTTFHAAIVTLTEDGDVVLGLSLDDPSNDPAVAYQASAVLAELINDFAGQAGICAGELPAPQSREEWAEADLVLFRVGRL